MRNGQNLNMPIICCKFFTKKMIIIYMFRNPQKNSKSLVSTIIKTTIKVVVKKIEQVNILSILFSRIDNAFMLVDLNAIHCCIVV